MNRIFISGRGCYIPHGVELGQYAESLNSECLVGTDDIERYSQDKRFMQNERIAYESMFAISKAIENVACSEKIDFENSGIVLGSFCGCIEKIASSEENIAVKAEKGVSPRDAVSSILCGAGSKNAIKFGLKSFNLTVFSGSISGMDAVITAYKLIPETDSSYAVLCAGDTDRAYSALLLRGSDNADKGTFILGYSKGIVFGKDIDRQLDNLIKKALKNSCITGDIVTNIIVCNETEQYNKTLSEICKVLTENAELNIISYPDSVGCAKGIFSVMYAEKMLEIGQSALVTQIDKDGRFSCIVIERT